MRIHRLIPPSLRLGSFAAALTLLSACDAGGGAGEAMRHAGGGAVDTSGLRDRAVPTEYEAGRAVFQQHCAQCHGEAALGTGVGPPLVHIVYEPNHHADAAFLLATLRGVRAHHWTFGDMPPIPGISPEEVSEVVEYVRWLQREAGVY